MSGGVYGGGKLFIVNSLTSDMFQDRLSRMVLENSAALGCKQESLLSHSHAVSVSVDSSKSSEDSPSPLTVPVTLTLASHSDYSIIITGVKAF